MTQILNPVILEEVLLAYQEYKMLPDYIGYAYINRISDLVMQDPDKYPRLSRMKISGMRAKIGQFLRAVKPMEQIRGSSSGRGSVYREIV